MSGVNALERAAREWIATLPAGVATTEEQKIDAGVILTVRPKKVGAMHVAVGFGSMESVDLYWGTDFRVEDFTADGAWLIRVLESIRNGKVVEEVWTVWGKVASVVSVIEVDERTVSSRVVRPLWALRPIARRASVRQYVSWD
jgi:hypothetical protein